MSITKQVKSAPNAMRQELGRTVTSKTIDGAMVGMPVAVIMVWLFEVGTSINIPTEVATSFGGLMSVAAGLLIPERRRK